MRKIFKNNNAVSKGLESISMFVVFFVVAATILATISDPFSQEQMLSEKRLDAIASEIAKKLFSTPGEDKSGLTDWEKHVASVDQNDLDSISSIGLAPNPSEISYSSSLDYEGVTVYFYPPEPATNQAPGQPQLTDDPPGPYPTPTLLQQYCTECEGGCVVNYYAKANDPEGDFLHYYFDWGDGTHDWVLGDGLGNPIPSGAWVSKQKEWDVDVGTYFVKVRAYDVYNSPSPWSIPIAVLVTDDPMQIHWAELGPIIIIDPLAFGGEGGLILDGFCFGAGTKIVMADEENPLKNIEDVEVNDKIKAFDEETGEYVEDEIVAVFHDSPEDMKDDYYLKINEKLDVTAEHRLFIDGEWVKAGDLKIGDKFTNKNNIESIEKIMQRIPTYNLDSKTYDTFVVSLGSDEFIVAHNDDIDLSKMGASAGDSASASSEEDIAELQELAESTYVVGGYSEGNENSDRTEITKDSIRVNYLIDTGKVEALSLKASDLSFYESVLKPSLNLGEDVEVAISVSSESGNLLNYQPAGSPSDATMVASLERTALSYMSSSQAFGDVVTLSISVYQY